MMTTITIDNGEQLARKKFRNLEDLRNYLTSLLPEQTFQLSEAEGAELDRRYKELKSGKVRGISMHDIEAKFEAKITS